MTRTTGSGMATEARMDQKGQDSMTAKTNGGALATIQGGVPQTAGSATTGLTLEEARARLTGKGGKKYWRSLEELAGAPGFDLRQDGTRYFDIHHSADDTFDKVDKAQFDQNVAAWAAVAWLLADSDVDLRAATKSAKP